MLAENRDRPSLPQALQTVLVLITLLRFKVVRQGTAYWTTAPLVGRLLVHFQPSKNRKGLRLNPFVEAIVAQTAEDVFVCRMNTVLFSTVLSANLNPSDKCDLIKYLYVKYFAFSAMIITPPHFNTGLNKLIQNLLSSECHKTNHSVTIEFINVKCTLLFGTRI